MSSDFSKNTNIVNGALTQLRAYMSGEAITTGSRIPPERELSKILGVSRASLRKAIAVLEDEGKLWRHVGKGAFVGTKPVSVADALQGLETRTNPMEMMRARLVMEVAIVREASLHATHQDIAVMKRCLKASRESKTWRQYEASDNQLHSLIAEATHNQVLIALYDALNAVRRTIVWTRRRDEEGGPPSDHHSFAEHEAIVAAIVERDASKAERLMHEHLSAVLQRLLSMEVTTPT